MHGTYATAKQIMADRSKKVSQFMAVMDVNEKTAIALLSVCAGVAVACSSPFLRPLRAASQLGYPKSCRCVHCE